MAEDEGKEKKRDEILKSKVVSLVIISFIIININPIIKGIWVYLEELKATLFTKLFW